MGDPMGDVHPPNPLFARRASELLEEGLVDEAIAVCLDGTAQYPWYATGALVLGECYEAKGKYTEAAEQYRRALAIHPDSYLLHRLLVATEKQLQQQQVLGQTEESRIEALPDTPQQEAGSRTAAETGVEFMLRRLAEAKVTPPSGSAPPTGIDGTRRPPSNSRIVTVTLAEIYASQGEYAEAVYAYRQLIAQRPDETNRFQNRLAELEELARAQKGSS